MTVTSRERLCGGAAASALLLALLFLPTPAAAQRRDDPQGQQWATQAGDDPRWARPDFSDAAWPRVAIRSTWREQGRQGYDGIVWFRASLTPGAEARLAAAHNELGLLLGPPAYGSYDVYAGGRWLGRSRGWSAALPFGFASVFRVPREAVGRDGTVSLALRMRRIGWASDREPQSAPVSAALELGPYGALAEHVRVVWSGHLLSEVPLVVLAALFGVAFLHHFLLYARRRRQIEHLWFALFALAYAVNTFGCTYWIYELTANRGIATRITDLTGHLAAAFAIQFLWTFFGKPVSPLLRAYQLSHVALALFVGLWPDLRAIFVTGTVRWLWLLPLLVMAAVLVLRQARRGDAEARLIAIGGVIMVMVQTAELARNVLGFSLPFDFSMAAFGFGAVILTMSVALSLRFRRVHDELDRLRYRLEEEVQERTRQLEESRDDALAGLRAKNEFLANISHEIRTPMNGVIGMAELLARTPLTDEQRTQLATIQSSSHSLTTLLNDILDFSRLESNAVSVERRPFSIRSVVDECLEIMTPLADGKGVTLGSSIAGGTVETLAGDPNRTRQVLLNLLSNAIKFTAAGRIDVTVSSKPLEDGRFEVRFSVTDTGLGIAGDDFGRLFVAFQQLEGSSSRRYGGAGLGLAISKRLTELMGGTITVESAPGRGSTFCFTIAGEAAAPPAPPSAAPPRQPGATRRTLRVLLAEDDAINRIVVLDMLEQLGHRADAANDGLEALHALEQHAYDVVLMDIQMPGMDGLEVTRRVRSTKGDQLHIVALTAHALSGDRERCLAAGMNGYLSKPVRLADLQNALAGVG
jgi:signal transduction histidine kinase/CheY-like chemotaxis protein